MVLVFKNGEILSQMEKWYYKGAILEVVNGFTYGGLLFSTRLSMDRMLQKLCMKDKGLLTSILSPLHTSLHTYSVMSKETFFIFFISKEALSYSTVRTLWD